MAFSLEVVQDSILAYLDGQFAQPVVEMAVPDRDTVLRDELGNVKALIAVQFGDVMQEGKRNMATPMGDDYHLPIFIQYVAPKASDARKLYNKGLSLFLGHDFPFSGSVRKRVGGSMFTLNASNAATEAYMFPASFKLLTQLIPDVG